MQYRSATGIDFHTFDTSTTNPEANFIHLSGLKVPYKYNILAHSDGDVVLHALVDAMLGIACLGDIGQHFSDKDPRWKGANSSIFVNHALELLVAKGIKLTHIDATIICEEPKISPIRSQMQACIAALCRLDVSCVNIKGKTTEKMGFLGRGEGIASLVSCTATMPL